MGAVGLNPQRSPADGAAHSETTVNDVSFFKHHRKVEHRQGPASRELAPLKKTIYSLIDLHEILLGCNRRYLEYLNLLEDPSAGVRALGSAKTAAMRIGPSKD